MNFIDLKKQYEAYKLEIDAQIKETIESTQFIMGPKVTELEKKLAEYVGTRNCIACSSGTDALLIPLLAKGIRPGDEIITTPFTFIATAEVVSLLGAKPVFVDIEEETFNIDPRLIEKAVTKKTKGIIPVSLYGQAADMDDINSVAKKHDLFVLEDACQSFGAEYKGKRSCGLSEIGATSFFPSKPLGCYGDGGAIFTNDDKLAATMRAISVHGQKERYRHSIIGINGRLDALQAGVLLAKLGHFDEELGLRSRKAEYYTEKLSGYVRTPQIKSHNKSVYAQYTIRVKRRDEVASRLMENGIPTAVHYPLPLHLQPAFSHLGHKEGEFPVSEPGAKEVLSLPFHPFLTQKEQDEVIRNVKEAVEYYK